jgi:hypothetical protein
VRPEAARSATIRRKVKRELALNLSELSIASGWDRNTLSAMNLPLEHGKIIYSDFRRVLHRRQDAHEDSINAVKNAADTTRRGAAVGTCVVSALADRLESPQPRQWDRRRD